MPMTSGFLCALGKEGRDIVVVLMAASVFLGVNEGVYRAQRFRENRNR